MARPKRNSGEITFGASNVDETLNRSFAFDMLMRTFPESMKMTCVHGVPAETIVSPARYFKKWNFVVPTISESLYLLEPFNNGSSMSVSYILFITASYHICNINIWNR